MCINITEMTNFSEYLVQEMLRNVLTWDHTSEQAIIILEKNEELMNKYQTFSERKLTKTEECRLRQLIVKTQAIIEFLKTEKEEMMSNINAINHSQRGVNNYMSSYSDSYFIDKDF